jgi:F0F1-type ATP synthase assembly protein I
MLPGAGGGLAWFLCGLKNGWIRNNKFVKKAVLEVIGGMLVASFVGYPLSPLFSGATPVVVICFAIGGSWSGIMQILRVWVTKLITNVLNDSEGK